MSDNKAIIRRFWEGVFAGSRSNTALIEELVSLNITDHAPFPGQAPGRDGFAATIAYINAAFPDMTLKVEDVIGESDRAVARWRARGTHKGEFMGMAPTNRPIDIGGITILRIADGKIVDDWTQWDGMTMMQQLTPQEAAATPA